jgi:hypothetical protein
MASGHDPVSLVESKLHRRSALAILSMQVDGQHFSHPDTAHTHVSIQMQSRCIGEFCGIRAQRRCHRLFDDIHHQNQQDSRDCPGYRKSP